MKTILFTDGAARGNPGPGGWGFVLIDITNVQSPHMYQGSASKAHTTNNAMELSAVVFGVKTFLGKWGQVPFLKVPEVSVKKVPDPISQNHKPHLEIRLDSKYVRDGAVSWRHGWSRNGWITKEKNAISNIELWQELHDLLNTAARDGIVIEWNLVRGHRGIMGNEMCDLLATTAADTQSELSISEIPLPKSFSLDELLHVPEKVDPYYIAVVDGRKQTFTTWADCSQWVLGKKARYKKVHSKSEEQQVLRDWNIPFE